MKTLARINWAGILLDMACMAMAVIFFLYFIGIDIL